MKPSMPKYEFHTCYNLSDSRSIYLHVYYEEKIVLYFRELSIVAKLNSLYKPPARTHGHGTANNNTEFLHFYS